MYIRQVLKLVTRVSYDSNYMYLHYKYYAGQNSEG